MDDVEVEVEDGTADTADEPNTDDDVTPETDDGDEDVSGETGPESPAAVEPSEPSEAAKQGGRVRRWFRRNR